jgi:hypothetical protein
MSAVEQLCAAVKTASPDDVVFMTLPEGMPLSHVRAFMDAFRAQIGQARESGQCLARCIVVPPGARVSFAREAANVLTREEFIELGKSLDAAAIAGGIDDPEERGDVLLEEFARRAIETAMRRMGDAQ